MSDRWDAFRKPIPDGWSPQPGDYCWWNSLNRLCLIKAVLLPDLFLIEYGDCNGTHTKQELIKNLRPINTK